ncbi:MAG: efflux RND transporter periplasmic adaptor subunit [Pseudomonadota bacterium]
MKHFKAFAALLVLAACGQGQESALRRPDVARPIIPYTIDFAADERVVQAVGTARARLAATVRPETAGFVESVLYTPGAFVEEGTPILALEADEERLAVRLAKVSVQEAEQLLARYRRIENTGAVSDSAIDEAKTQLQAAQIALEQAELRLRERTVGAPFAGFLGLTDVDPGSRIDQTTAIAALDDRRVLYIDFAVPEDAFGALTAGSEVEAIPFSSGAEPRIAKIVTVDSRVDPESRAFTARAALDNSDDRLRPGMSFEVRFAIKGRNYPLVPEASIVWGANGAYVWAVRQGRATEVPVNIVSRQEGSVLVDAKLERGAIVVAEGVQKVREGTAVVYDDSIGVAGPGLDALD